jgi:hypothetical protein
MPAQQQVDDLFERDVRCEIVDVESTIREASDLALDVT